MDGQIITSRQNPLVKSVCGLAEKKKRAESGLFRFDGIKLLEEVLQTDIPLKYVILRQGADGRAEALARAAEERGAQAICVSAEVFEKITDERSPEGIVTVACIPRGLHAVDGAEDAVLRIKDGERILLLESVRDPGNLGTVIRSCFALGIDRLVLTSDCADLYNPKTIRAAMGAIFKLPTVTVPEGALADCVTALRRKGRAVYATALHRSSVAIGELSLRVGDCFVIGNEGHGLRADTVEASTSPMIIPMREGAESLNAAAAAAICIWETVKVR